MLEKIIDVFTPQRGFVGSVLSFIVGIIPNFEKATKDNITFLFQITAFSISILVGILTIIHLHYKLMDRKKANKLHKKQGDGTI